MTDKPMSFEPPSAKAEATGRGVGPADADKATGTTDKPAGKVATSPLARPLTRPLARPAAPLNSRPRAALSREPKKQQSRPR